MDQATTYSYDANGNLHVVKDLAGWTTMTYDKENRLIRHDRMTYVPPPGQNTAWRAVYSYDGDGLKRTESSYSFSPFHPPVPITTLVWDGSDYLEGRAWQIP
jgi:uncharacterized protein RhaS with RHS repeats